jgi:lipoate-protein ligase A
MHFVDLTLPTLAENLALDEALLLEAEAGRGREVLRVWEWPALAVVLGAGGKLAEEVDTVRCERDNVPVLRRSSGGGTVLLGPGCLCFSLVLAYERSAALREIPFSYVYILGKIADALAGLLPGIAHAGTSDLAADGRKFSGNSQQRKRHFLLHHGTLLYAFAMTKLADYLPLPSRQPDYRQHREHSAFLCNLPTAATDLKQRLRTAWQAKQVMDDWPTERVRELAAKYTAAEWVRRR